MAFCPTLPPPLWTNPVQNRVLGAASIRKAYNQGQHRKKIRHLSQLLLFILRETAASPEKEGLVQVSISWSSCFKPLRIYCPFGPHVPTKTLLALLGLTQYRWEVCSESLRGKVWRWGSMLLALHLTHLRHLPDKTQTSLSECPLL